VPTKLIDDLDQNPIPALQDPKRREELAAFECAAPLPYAKGQTTIEAVHYQAQPLENNQSYLVRVALRDSAGNFGRLSPPACGTPMEHQGIGDAYAQAGGLAGGGYCDCAFPHDENDITAHAAGGGLALAALLVRRKSRRRSRSSSLGGSPR
jgi:hypothetical protein